MEVSTLADLNLVYPGECSGSFETWTTVRPSQFSNYYTSSAPYTVSIVNSAATYADVNAVAGGYATISDTITDVQNSPYCWASASGQDFVQVPTSLSIVAGSDSTTSESGCTTSGGLAGCGVARTFTYQINNQNTHPINIANMAVGDVICNTSTNQLNLQGAITTCGGTTGACAGTSGPCGKYANASGQFPELLKVCAPACKPSGTCTTAGQTVSNQTWYVNGRPLSSDVKSISYQCNKILVNGN